MRLFLAIFPPKEIAESFAKILENLRSYNKYLRFVKHEHMHISLRFLGSDVSEESLKKIQKVLKSIKFSSFNLKIKEVRFGFPGQRWPRILYVSVARNEALDKLASKLNADIDALDREDIYLRDFRQPIYHFTLSRVKKKLNKKVVFDIRRKIESVELWEGFRVGEICLVKSELKREGPKYEVSYIAKAC
jgi:2'-5' RNA ligase